MTDEGEPDAELVVKKTHIGSLIAWRWSDGRVTVNQTEHQEMEGLVHKAEERYDAADLDSDEVVATIHLNEEDQVQGVEWVA